ncbi:MAG: VanZ family protein [Geminicoccaceae bacterium]|jgi:VanZ family protein|nr:VanZ family protein [Geminicoccaceae bacterium]MCB9968659.1 VanZ family protein [Geminicoccaceae bacterium]HRY23553.1 VanZ family protein [Geminicoccaceae bacterium]
MPSERGLRAAALVLWLAAWAVVTWAMLDPAPPDLAGQSDKLVHFGSFFLISITSLGFCRGSGQLLAAGLVCLVAAVGLELTQGLVPSRTFEAADMAANLAGVATGMALARFALVRLGRRPSPA